MADKVKHYVSESEAYVGGQLHRPGEPFATDAAPAEDWTEITPKEAAVADVATQRVPDDAELEALPKPALQAVAYMRHVAGLGTLDVEGLRNAIRASYEAAL